MRKERSKKNMMFVIFDNDDMALSYDEIEKYEKLDDALDTIAKRKFITEGLTLSVINEDEMEDGDDWWEYVSEDIEYEWNGHTWLYGERQD